MKFVYIYTLNILELHLLDSPKNLTDDFKSLTVCLDSLLANLGQVFFTNHKYSDVTSTKNGRDNN